MPANSFAQGEYGESLQIPTKHGRAQLVYAEAVIAGGVAAPSAANVANSAPGCSISGGASGAFTFSYPNCHLFIPLGEPVVEQSTDAGSHGQWDVITASTGLNTFETSITPGTGAAPADGSIVRCVGLAVMLR